MSDLRERAQQFYDSGMQCNCDLDNWEPTQQTGHSWVCRIHKAVMAECAALSRARTGSEAQ